MDVTDDERRSALAVVRDSRALAYTIGAVTLVAGLVLLFWPDRTITVVARLSGVLLVIVGIGDLVDAIRHHRSQPYTGLLILRSLLNIGFGIALVAWSGITVAVLAWLVGLDLVLAGVLGLVVRGRMPAEFRSSMLTRSLVTIALGLVIMVWPGATLEVMAWLVGLGLALFGLAMLWSGRQVGKLAHELEG